jgi:hypothetical protein
MLCPTCIPCVNTYPVTQNLITKSKCLNKDIRNSVVSGKSWLQIPPICNPGFHNFPQFFYQMQRWYWERVLKRSPPHHFQLVTTKSSYRWMLYKWGGRNCIDKYMKNAWTRTLNSMSTFNVLEYIWLPVLLGRCPDSNSAVVCKWWKSKAQKTGCPPPLMTG